MFRFIGAELLRFCLQLLFLVASLALLVAHYHVLWLWLLLPVYLVLKVLRIKHKLQRGAWRAEHVRYTQRIDLGPVQ